MNFILNLVKYPDIGNVNNSLFDSFEKRDKNTFFFVNTITANPN
jgi:hypothetical protein